MTLIQFPFSKLRNTSQPRFTGNTPQEESTQAEVPSIQASSEDSIQLQHGTAQPGESPWLTVLDDLLKQTDPHDETINGVPVAYLFYLREKLRRTPIHDSVDAQGKIVEQHPCPLPGEVSPPWSLLDQDTVGSNHPDSKRFWDIINGKNTPKDLLDKISKRQVKIGPKGQISFPAPTIKRPRVWWGPPGSQQSKRGQQGKNGKPDPGQSIGSHPGKKAGDTIGKQPAKGNGSGQGEQGAEGTGEYPKELWTPPVPRSQVAKLLQAEWGLPFIQPRGQGKMNKVREIWDQTTTTPPNQIDRYPTLKNAIQRSYAKAWYDKPLSMEQRIQNGMHEQSPALPVQRILLEGNTLVGHSTLKKAIQPFENKALQYTDLEKILTVLDQKYAAHGFASSRAIIPAQSLQSGDLKIDIREVRDTFLPANIQVHGKDNVRIAAREEKKPVAKTAMIYIMDVSGSVSNDMKEMARVQNYFLDTHLMYQYGLVAAQLSNEKYDDKKHFGQGVARRFIVHTDGAEEASEEEFYTTGQSGGTRISSGFELAKEIINKDFPTDQWNIYIFYQGDGDNYSNDNDPSIQLMKGLLDNGVNMIGYTHLAPYMQGSQSNYDGLNHRNFYHSVKKELNDRVNVRTSILHKPELDEYKQSIQKLLEEPGAKNK